MICRLLGPSLVVVVVGLFVSCAAPAPKNERPDLSGTWGHAVVFGLEFVRGEKLPDGSVCVFG
ncbi:MAG TPA: hypothetical protein VGJ39_11085, partial [Vicinamibacterales bacterium]